MRYFKSQHPRGARKTTAETCSHLIHIYGPTHGNEMQARSHDKMPPDSAAQCWRVGFEN